MSQEKFSHHHDPENKRRIVNRLARAAGHLDAVKRMVENDRDCSEVLVQLAAVQSALNSAGKEIINDHIQHCLVHAIEDQDSQALEDFRKAIDKFI